MPLVSKAIHDFLQATKTFNADLADRWSIDLETQINVIAGEPVAGRKSTWSNDTDTWHSIRIPKRAATDPTWTDYELRFPLDLYVEGIGLTGWEWKTRRSLWVGFDVDSLVGHAKGVGISEEDIEKVKQAACALPYIEVRRSTGGLGLHLYCYLATPVPTANHTEHAALARCILGLMSAEVGFDFANQVDACGQVLWVYHRKMTPENRGLEIIKPAEHPLTDIPPNWLSHLDVIRRKQSKVRINDLPDAALDPFETLTATRRIVPLDATHRAHIEALKQSGFTTLWVQDHHLLQTHTKAFESLLTSDLGIIGVYQTSSEGKDAGTPNCFAFPLVNGAWKLYRFTPGAAEAATWTQDAAGWTTCTFNRVPDLAAVAKLHGGEPDPQGGFTFSDADKAAEVLALYGKTVNMANYANIRLVQRRRDIHIIAPRERDAEQAEGWIIKGRTFQRLIEIPQTQNDTLTSEHDRYLRAIYSPITKTSEGLVILDDNKGLWVHRPENEVRKMLIDRGFAPPEADRICGGALNNSWCRINVPFQPEYPGGRQWNQDAAQFRFQPAEIDDDEIPHHPTWDMICDHIGADLTETLQSLPWARDAHIRTGGDYIRHWIACAFREPFEPLPYLFLYGNMDCGKSTLYESLRLLVTKGVVQADRAIATEFNGELNGAIICAVEERDFSNNPQAVERIKAYVTGRTISLRAMRRDAHDVLNTTHWIQTANKSTACPVPSGDTRITMICVSDLTEKQRQANPKHLLQEHLEQEAPHFLYTLLQLELPPLIDRLRIPAVSTARKLAAEEASRTALEEFVKDYCEPSEAKLLFKDFYERFLAWAPINEKHIWTRKRVRAEFPHQYTLKTGHANRLFIHGLTIKGDINE